MLSAWAVSSNASSKASETWVAMASLELMMLEQAEIKRLAPTREQSSIAIFFSMENSNPFSALCVNTILLWSYGKLRTSEQGYF
jgi:hypothetical protein